MKIAYFILIGIVVIVLVILIHLIYSGLFSRVIIKEKTSGPYNMFYVEYRGDYSKVGPIHQDVYSYLLENGIKTTKGIAIYYDDPKTIPKENLRSDIGSIIDTGDVSKLVGDKYKFKVIPSREVVYSSFPYNTTVSIMLGVFKVYPKMNQYISNKGYTISSSIEIYDKENKKIYYEFEIIK